MKRRTPLTALISSMTKPLSIFACCIPVFAYANAPKIEITSFQLIAPNSRAAEICGKVSGAQTPLIGVRLEVDPQSNNPAVYNTFASNDGLFCSMIVTYTGRATASVWLPNGQTIQASTEVFQTKQLR